MTENKQITITYLEAEDITLRHLLECERLKDEDKILSFLSGVPLEYLPALDAKELYQLRGHYNNLLQYSSEFQSTFIYDGVEYGFFNMDKMTTKELIDVDNYLDGGYLAEWLSVIYRPIINRKGDQYEIEPYIDAHDKFKDIPLHIYNRTQAFFLTVLKQLRDHSLLYSSPNLTKEMMEVLI